MIGAGWVSTPATRVAGASIGAGIAAPGRHVAPVQTVVTRSGAVVTGAAQGPAGPAGTDHGYATYTEAVTSPPITLLPSVRQQLMFTATVGGAILATSPFAQHPFWDGFRIQPRKVGDTAIVRLDLTSTAFVTGGNLVIEVDIGGAFGVIQTVPRMFNKPAGQAEQLSEAFPVYMGPTFEANGGALYLTASVPTEISLVGLVIFPLSAAP